MREDRTGNESPSAGRAQPTRSVPRRQKRRRFDLLAARWLVSRRPRRVPVISCHQVDACRYGVIGSRAALPRGSVEPAGRVGVGSATAGRQRISMVCAVGACREAAGRSLIGVALREHRSQDQPRRQAGYGGNRPSRPGGSAVLAGNLRTPAPILDATGDPNYGPRVATGASQYSHLPTAPSRMLLLRFPEDNTIPRRKPAAR
jgi:hypothetical protein